MTKILGRVVSMLMLSAIIVGLVIIGQAIANRHFPIKIIIVQTNANQTKFLNGEDYHGRIFKLPRNQQNPIRESP